MSNSSNLVSVIIPCYKYGHYLPDALNSILNQSYVNWECIIVNDGSPDNTDEIAREWVLKDKRYKYYKKNNGGASSSRNLGLRHAKGDFIQFLDADDVIDPKKLELQIQAMEGTSEYALSISDYFSSYENDLLKPYPYYVTPKFKSDDYILDLISDWETRLSIPIHCFLFKKEVFNNSKILFVETLPNNEDWECWMNIFKLKPDIKYIDLKLATYRIQKKGVSSNRKLMKIGYLQAIEIQKSKFIRNSIEYTLLVNKYNKILFGIHYNQLKITYGDTSLGKFEYLVNINESNIEAKLQDENNRTMFNNSFSQLPRVSQIDLLEDWQRNDILIVKQERLIAELKNELELVHKLKSLRITKPFRIILRLVKRLMKTVKNIILIK